MNNTHTLTRAGIIATALMSVTACTAPTFDTTLNPTVAVVRALPDYTTLNTVTNYSLGDIEHQLTPEVLRAVNTLAYTYPEVEAFGIIQPTTNGIEVTVCDDSRWGIDLAEQVSLFLQHNADELGVTHLDFYGSHWAPHMATGTWNPPFSPANHTPQGKPLNITANITATIKATDD